MACLKRTATPSPRDGRTACGDRAKDTPWPQRLFNPPPFPTGGQWQDTIASKRFLGKQSPPPGLVTKAAYDELLSFVAAFSYAAVRRVGLAVCECEEISQEVSLGFRRSRDPAKTNDSPCALKAFIAKLTDRSLVDYFRKLAGYRACSGSSKWGRVVEKEPAPLLEQSESRGETPPAAKGGGEDLGGAGR